MRLFTAIQLPPEAEQAVKEVQERLKQVLVCNRWQSLHNLHITLHFLGEVGGDIVKELVDEMAKSNHFSAFQLELKQLGVFPNEHRPRVLYLELGGEIHKLNVLQRSLSPMLQKFGYDEMDKVYTPHITLAREPKGSLDLLSLNSTIGAKPSVKWIVDKVILFKSEFQPGKAVHTILAEYPLDPQS